LGDKGNKQKALVGTNKDKQWGEVTLKDIITDQPPTPDEDTVYHSPLFRESTTFSTSSLINNVAGIGLQQRSTSSSLNGYSSIGDGEASNSASTTSLNPCGTQILSFPDLV